MARLTEKKIDAAIERAYGKHAQGRTINVMKIGAVFKDARKAIAESAAIRANIPMTLEEVGVTLEREMPAIVARYTEPA